MATITHEEMLKLAREGWHIWQMAEHFGKSVSTVKRNLKAFGISLRGVRYSSINDHDLKKHVQEILSMGHECGEITVDSRLKVMGHTVQRSRIRKIMGETVPPKERKLRKIFRRDYYCRSPLSIVHMDGYHKLIRWRFVLHGSIDGFSRRLFFLGISDNNRSSTVLRLFKQGVYKYGLPSRIRIDKGKENMGAAKYMLARRGCGRSSVLAGKSTHNTRIERLWVDVAKRCTGPFRKLFKDMEKAGILSHKSENDLYCLHLVFLPLLEKSVYLFLKSWDLHKHRSLKHKSPKWVFEQGLMQMTSYAKVNGIRYTELCQVDWRTLDAREAIEEEEFEVKIVVPRIRCPLCPKEDAYLRKKICKMNLNWKNCVDRYLEVRRFVSNLV